MAIRSLITAEKAYNRVGRPPPGWLAFLNQAETSGLAAIAHTARLARCHFTNREAVAAALAAAKDGRGPTVFDRLVGIFEEETPA
ncbi:hypothetical protein [Streptomyces melanogenes]|uniref:hypothetical protein n=1 Tax=Streptomyces melanogenes TaxID=67326 RepID=UPI0037A966DD